MRILMLSQFYPPIMGGIERHVHSLSSALASRGHQVSVATFWHPGLADFEMDGAVRVYRIHATMQRIPGLFTTGRFHAPPFPDPEVMAALRKVVEKEQPEIVHAHNWLVYSFLPIKAWSKAHLVMTLHDCELTCVQMRMMYKDQALCSGPGFSHCLGCAAHHYGPAKGSLTYVGNRVMSGMARSLVDLFLPVSNAIADASQLTGGNTPYQVVPNFVPDDVACLEWTADPGLSALPEQGYILQVGDLVRDKGVFVLLEAYQALNNPPPLVLIGRRMPESPRELPRNVTLLESLPHPLVMQAWQRSLFGTVPSLCLDASPTVTVEAMASGKPVVASRIGGIVDQVDDGKTGFLVPPGDVDALRQAMASLIENPALQAQMGAAARNKVTQFQASTIVSRIEDIYQTLCSPSSRN